MSRSEFPRVHELIALLEDRTNPDAYFQDFDSRVQESPEIARVWRSREREFQRLDSESWKFLESELFPYLTARNPHGRGWAQLISMLNQARAHNYLEDIGCRDIRFIPRSKLAGMETPDLEANLDDVGVVCEVKTIGISDCEAEAHSNIRARSIAAKLDTGFMDKLDSVLCKARSQLGEHKKPGKALCVAFLVINFDDLLGEYKDFYYKQIDGHLAAFPNWGCRIVFFNQRTCFHEMISMVNAEVVNEAG